jgi:hypothetical protein
MNALAGRSCRATIVDERSGNDKSYPQYKRSPLAVHRSPFTVHRSPFTVHRSPFTVRRSPFAVRRSPFGVRSAFAGRRLAFEGGREFFVSGVLLVHGAWTGPDQKSSTSTSTITSTIWGDRVEAFTPNP